jgi:hypothetical protein
MQRAGGLLKQRAANVPVSQILRGAAMPLPGDCFSSLPMWLGRMTTRQELGYGAPLRV